MADLWIEYKNDPQFEDFVNYNDLGLPLAYAISNKMVASTKIAQGFIEETFSLLLELLGVEDTGFETLDDILVLAAGF